MTDGNKTVTATTGKTNLNEKKKLLCNLLVATGILYLI